MIFGRLLRRLLLCRPDFAQRARAAAAILFLPAAEIVRVGFAGATLLFPTFFAHRAFWARLIRLRANADNVRLSLPFLRDFPVPFNDSITEIA